MQSTPDIVHTTELSETLAQLAAAGPCVMFDVDGVCLDFARHFAACHEASYPEWSGPRPSANPDRYDFGVPASHVAACVAAAHHDDLPLVHDAMPDVLRRLQEVEGVMCVAVTAYPHAGPRTRNLLRHFLDFRYVIHGVTDKTMFYTLPNVVAIVDDWPAEHILARVPGHVQVCVPGRWRYTRERFTGDARVAVLYDHPDAIVAAVRRVTKSL